TRARRGRGPRAALFLRRLGRRHRRARQSAPAARHGAAAAARIAADPLAGSAAVRLAGGDERLPARLAQRARGGVQRAPLAVGELEPPGHPEVALALVAALVAVD